MRYAKSAGQNGRTTAEYSPKQMPNQKKLDRRAAYKLLGKLISKRAHKGPTAFNPHFSIRAKAVASEALSLKVGPQMKTQQWEPTARRPLGRKPAA